MTPPASAGRPAAPRIGLYGGAFDPPHNAHLALACAAVSQLGLQRLHIVPTGSAWHKSRPLSSAAHRLAMCRLAFAGDARFVVDASELQRPGPSYTIDTLRQLQAQYPGAQLFLQMGADQASAFHGWRQAGDILRMAIISIAERPLQTCEDGISDPSNPLPGLAADAARIRRLRLPAMPHSATEVRRRAAAGLPLDGLVPAAVARYIAQHHLYQAPPSR